MAGETVETWGVEEFSTVDPNLLFPSKIFGGNSGRVRWSTIESHLQAALALSSATITGDPGLFIPSDNGKLYLRTDVTPNQLFVSTGTTTGALTQVGIIVNNTDELPEGASNLYLTLLGLLGLINPISPVVLSQNGNQLDLSVASTVVNSVNATAPLQASIASNQLALSIDLSQFGQAPGYKYTWNQTLGTTPASGEIVATVAPVAGNAITLTVHDTDRDSGNVSALFNGLLADSVVWILDEASDDNYLVIQLTADAVDNASDTTLTGTVLRTQGTLPASEVAVSLFANSSTTGGHTIQDEAVDRPQRAGLNFIGPNVTAVDNAGGDRTDVTVADAIPTYDPALATPVDRHLYFDDANLKLGIFLQAINGGGGGYVFFGES